MTSAAIQTALEVEASLKKVADEIISNGSDAVANTNAPLPRLRAEDQSSILLSKRFRSGYPRRKCCGILEDRTIFNMESLAGMQLSQFT